MSSLTPSPKAPTAPRRLALVLVGDYISAYGMRKLAAAADELVPEVMIFFVPTGKRLHSIRNILLSSRGDNAKLTPADIATIAGALADYDLVGFSSMTIDAEWTKAIIAEVKRQRPDQYVLWGGIHPIVAPDDAIRHADAICLGEGDLAFDELLSRLNAAEDYTDVRNFWFAEGGEIRKNPHRPLMTPDEMAQRPRPLYAEAGKELLFRPGKGFRPLGRTDYLDFNGLSYHTLWTQGCPYRCSYCANTAFLAIDGRYARIRHSPVDYMVAEVREAVRNHPHINTIVFDDDAMAALPVAVLREFAERWKREVRIPFFVAGIVPSYVDREKLELLLGAGMNRLRMGIQSGSDSVLKFFKRPNKPGLILSACRIVGDYRDFMIPPAFDLIVDTPVERREDVQTTIRLVHELPRPFTLNVYSLRVIPGTVLADQVRGALDGCEIEMEGIDRNYLAVAPTKANALLFLAATVRLPDWLFESLLKSARPASEKQKLVPVRLFLFRSLFYVKRGLNDLRFMDFSVLPGRIGWLLWRVGLIGFWQKHLVRRFHPERDSVRPREAEVSMPAPRMFSADD